MTLTARAAALGFLRTHPDFCFFKIDGGTKNKGMPRGNISTAATNNPKAIAKWPDNCNGGLAIGRSGLIVVDVDCKPGAGGGATFDELDLHYGFPTTFTVRTPSGGTHLYYWQTDTVRHHQRRGIQGFGAGIDVTGYVVIPGSRLTPPHGDGFYSIAVKHKIVPAPDWFAQFIKPTETEQVSQVAVVELDKSSNIAWCLDYLQNHAKPSIEGRNGEKALLDVAGVLKDHGISQRTAVDLLATHYNVAGRCEPLWNVNDGPLEDRLDRKVENAWRYLTRNRPGAATAEAQFGDEDDNSFDGLKAWWKSFDRDNALLQSITVVGGEIFPVHRPKPASKQKSAKKPRGKQKDAAP